MLQVLHSPPPIYLSHGLRLLQPLAVGSLDVEGSRRRWANTNSVLDGSRGCWIEKHNCMEGFMGRWLDRSSVLYVVVSYSTDHDFYLEFHETINNPFVS